MFVVVRQTVRRGDDFTMRLQFRDSDTDVPIDISTWTSMNAQLRRKPDDEVKTTFAITVIGGGTTGLADLALTRTQTAALNGIYLWDMERIASSKKLTVAGGEINFTSDETRV